MSPPQPPQDKKATWLAPASRSGANPRSCFNTSFSLRRARGYRPSRSPGAAPRTGGGFPGKEPPSGGHGGQTAWQGGGLGAARQPWVQKDAHSPGGGGWRSRDRSHRAQRRQGAGHGGTPSAARPRGSGTRSGQAAHPKQSPHTSPPLSTPRSEKEWLGKRPQKQQGEGDEGASVTASPPPPPRPAPPRQRRLLRKSRACRSNGRRKSRLPRRPLAVSALPGASDWWPVLPATSRGLGAAAVRCLRAAGSAPPAVLGRCP